MSFVLQSNLPALNAVLRARASKLVRSTAASIEGRAKASMPGQKTGRNYKRGKRRHQASAPGETPAVDTGNLMNSIQAVQESDLHATIGVGAEYAVWLEFGTRRIAPRPFLGPAFEWAKPAFEQGLKELLK
jgi:HK97 gp10 family phage protein